MEIKDKPPASSGIIFADVNFWIGENYLFPKYSVDDNKAEQEIISGFLRNSIGTVFVSNFISLYYSPCRGNEITAGFLKANSKKKPQIHGVLFFEQQDFASPENFREKIIGKYNQGFCILRLLPKSHKYPYEKELFHKFYKVLNDIKFPIIINIDEMDITANKNIEWHKIADIANSYSEIPIILDGGDSKELMYNSYLLSLLDNFSNIYIETHNLLGFNQVEDLAVFKGAQRLIFGSYWPFMERNISVSRILNSGLESLGKQEIAAGNIQRIIKEINTFG
ncbi:MAG: hypothetical protein FJW68_04505 [Actinobacteria bacterium]|nr:hypothetical protein [Actinomycetota bacterium]